MADNKDKIGYGFADNFGFTSPFGENSIFSEQSRKKDAAQRAFREQQANLKKEPDINKYKSFQTLPLNLPEDNVDTRFFCRLGMVKDVKLHYLFDEQRIHQCYTYPDNQYYPNLAGTPILLPIGTRVAIISKNHLIGGANMNRVITFWKGQYREGYMVSEACKQLFLGYSIYTGEVFINDIERIIYNIEAREATVKQKYKQFESIMPPGTFDDYYLSHKDYSLARESYDYVKKSLPSLKDSINKNQINFENIAKNYYNDCEIIKDADYVTSLQKMLSFLDLKFSDFMQKKSILILPFSQEWFNMRMNIQEILSIREQVQNYGNLWSELSYDVGVTHPFSDSKSKKDSEILQFLETVHTAILSSELLKKTFEGKWLINNMETIRNNSKNIIGLGTGCWKLPRWSSKASELAIQNSFGNIYATGAITVLIHELDQDGGGYIPSDTHVPLGDYNDLIEQIQQVPIGNFVNKFVYKFFELTPEQKKRKAEQKLYVRQGDAVYNNIDLLFACNSFHGVVFMEIFLKKYLASYTK